VNKIIGAVLGWFACILCGWPLKDGTNVCPNCNNGRQ